MNPQPKKKPGRSPEYLEHIRGLPCSLCPEPVDPHHTLGGGMGMKGSDFSVIPFCRKHHRECHQIGVKTFEKKYAITVKGLLADVLVKWCDAKLLQEKLMNQERLTALGTNILRLRQEREISLTDLATKANLEVSVLSAIESDFLVQLPPIEVVYAISEVLGVTIADLYGLSQS